MALLIHNNCEPLANAKFLNSTMFKLYRAIAPPCWAVFSSISYAGFDLTYFIDSCASRNLKAALEPLLYSSSRIHFLPLSILSASLRREVRVPESYIYKYVVRPPYLSPYSSLVCRIPSCTPCLYRAFHTRNPRKRHITGITIPEGVCEMWKGNIATVGQYLLQKFTIILKLSSICYCNTI